MSEYWKSTPKYWCKHCSIYVRDTKFERQNHEATGKHQGALKRFLRDLHRNHEQGQREKERAKREVERLTGIVSSASTDNVASTSKASVGGDASAPSQPPPSSSQRQKQWEQLAEMGIDIPTELRGDMAMASEWTVTNTRIIKDALNSELDTKPGNVDAVASGVRKRPKLEEDEEEEENAIKGLFKKPRKWGRDTKHAPETDTELDALLNGPLTTMLKPEEKSENVSKNEDLPNIKKEDHSTSLGIKKEIDEDTTLLDIKPKDVGRVEGVSIKQEENTAAEAPAIVFKKRKPKNIRQR
ncbi:uncharacterized protein GGS22DRAFT_88069 [Annulohypoxylon maeteangense]|uniref:uncharacterized protein n=1 Tax=Annulohypoxylon maeteangense TaxID=1927788 RepID=UPI00200729B6|nr:uncharacterized protein GGS22DRAFT_88069 [Annulohypoxylon maeteangense]KAI0887697.1 hypothetical protein GGS22DRAFT_88069 [Annulohypoxylon maeteangense]